MSLNSEIPLAAGLPEEAPSPARKGCLARWIARVGIAGFLFFLIKGLAWLIVPAAIAAFAARS
jgi:hypothetical protein